MKQRITSKIIAISFCISLSSTIAIAQQGMLSKVSLEDQVVSSTLIVEGKVISKKSYWDVNHQNIYTVNEIEVYKVFKGQLLTTIEVVTPGGVVDFQAEQVSPSLGLARNSIGIFMLYENDKQLSSDALSDNSKFKPFSSIQGFYKYNKYENLAANPFFIKVGISGFYTEIENLVGRSKINISNFDIDVFTQNSNVLAVAITSIAPMTSSAGTESVLTITGTGFGATTGTVSFRNADDGGATYINALPTQIDTWTDTEITVEIPSSAGTGDVRVSHATDATSATSSILTISYAETTFNYDWSNGLGPEAYQTRHKDINGSGGYTWQMFTGFDANTTANESFVRSFDTWRCETKVNWTIGATTSTNVAEFDGINVIRFDIGAELPAGVLGRASTYASANCVVTDVIVYWYVAELDIVFDDGANWEFGPTNAVAPKVDFESVSAHELGHSHQLLHVIDSGVLMHWSIAAGDNNRVLSTNDIAGGNDVQSRSLVDIPCAPVDPMTDYVCNLSVADQLLAESIVLYPNPATNKLFIENKRFLNLESATIFDVTGRKLMTKDISENKVLDIKQLSQGIYFINILSDNATTTKRFIVK
ncbi:MAG: hypothetical protein COB73_08675 [Flavobacteriaceae bacterium]|nr:MAG: hypothetical protein COB73_08675 [Flavobacteriaceae bacterium]